jgi:hypothetical protein
MQMVTLDYPFPGIETIISMIWSKIEAVVVYVFVLLTHIQLNQN